MTTMAVQVAADIAQALGERVRVRTINGADDFERLFVHRSNLAYLLLYLESNNALTDSLRDSRRRLVDDPGADRAIAESLRELAVPAELEEARQQWLKVLDGRMDPAVRNATIAIEAAQARLADTLAGLERSAAQLAAQLLGDADRDPETAEQDLFGLVAGVGVAATRTRIRAARRAARKASVRPSTEALDEAVAARHAAARTRGADDARAEVLSRCGLDERTVRLFLDSLLQVASRDQAALAEKLQEAADEPLCGPVADHLPHHLRRVGSAAGVALDVDRLVTIALQGAAAILPVEFATVDPRAGLVRVLVDGEVAGVIAFQDWGEQAVSVGAQAPSSWDLDRPLAHVAIRATTDAYGRRLTSLNGCQRVLHELGHSVNHVLVADRRVTVSGLDYLPVERIDLMSMWFERWIYHPCLHEWGVLAGGMTSEALGAAQRLKQVQSRQAAAEHAVVAAIDFALHGPEGRGVEQEFRRLCDEHGVDRVIDLTDVLPYFGWPTLQGNPGAGFASAYAASLAEYGFSELLRSPEDAGQFLVEQALEATSPTATPDPNLAVSPGRWLG